MVAEFTATTTTKVAPNNVMRRAAVFSNPEGPGTLYILCRDGEPDDVPSVTNHTMFVPVGQVAIIDGGHWKGDIWAAFSEADSSAMITLL